MKRNFTKLTLHRETLAALDPEQTRQIAGGLTAGVNCGNTSMATCGVPCSNACTIVCSKAC